MYKKDKPFSMPASSIIRKERKSGKGNGQVTSSQIKSVLDAHGDDLNDVQVIMETLPDLKYAKTIKVSASLSPKTLEIPELKLAMKLSGNTKGVNPDLLTGLEEFFRTKYKLEKNLGKMLGDILFDYGSYPIVMLPPNELDRIIGGANLPSGESINEMVGGMNIGILGNDNGKDLDELYVSVTDNPNLLRSNLLKKRSEKEKLRSILGGESNFAPNVQSTLNINVPPLDKRENANPITMKWPADGIVPVYDPSDPSVHIGYYLATDPKTGLSVTKLKDSDVVSSLEERLSKLGGGSSSLVAQLTGIPFSVDKAKSSSQYLAAFENKLTEQLEQTLSSGMYGTVKVSNHSEIYKLMFHRALQKQKTRLCFVPADLVSYFALDHDSMGFGVSLITRTKLYAALRTLLMLADVTASVKNSTPQTDVNITLEEDDPEQLATVETILHSISQIDGGRVPIEFINPSDILNEFHRSNYRVKVDGGSAFPNTSTDITDGSRGVVRADTELMEYLTKQQYAGIGVPAELINRAMEGDFAVSTHTTNHLWAQSNNQTASDYSELLIDFIHKYARLSPELTKLINDNRGSLSFDEVFQLMYVNFPKQDSSSIEAKRENYEAYADYVDIVMEAYIAPEMLEDLVTDSDDLADVTESVKYMVAGQLKRNWLEENGYMPELTSFINKEDGKKFGKAIMDYTSNIITVIGDILKVAVSTSGKVDNKVRKAKDKADDKRNSTIEDEVPPTPPVEPIEEETPIDPAVEDDGLEGDPSLQP